MRLSKTDRLADGYQDKIIAWRMRGDTADEIRSKLQAENLPPDALPGRTGMSLYLRKLDKAREFLLRHRVATETLGRSFEENSEAKEARLNIELVGNLVTERLLQIGGENGEKINVKEVYQVAQIIYRLTRAQRTEALTTLGARKAAAQAARAAPAPAASQTAPASPEWSEEQIQRLKAKIAGVNYEFWMANCAPRLTPAGGPDTASSPLDRTPDGASATAAHAEPAPELRDNSA